MILGYATMVRIERPLWADSFRILWKRGGVEFDFRLPVDRMQMLFSGLMDSVRRTELQEPNVENADYKRGSRLADHIRYFTRHEPLSPKDFELKFHNGLRFKQARYQYMGMVRCDRPRDDGKHYPGRILFHAPGVVGRDESTDITPGFESPTV